jgi:hypothetical protein
VDTPAYPRVELSEGYALERYFGWSLVDHQSGVMKLLERRVGPLRRSLLLTDGLDDAEVETLFRRHQLLRPGTVLVFNDFSDGRAEPRTVLGCALRSKAEGRWFGIGTYVFDLSQDDATLFGKIASRERSKIRKSEREGIRTEFLDAPSRADCDQFEAMYARMVNERALAPLNRRWIDRMFDDRMAFLARSVAPDGQILTINIVYVMAEHGYYLYGVHDPTAPDPAGHLLHWATLRHLRAMGRRWYDFGLVSSADPKNGIYRFKKCFGGAFYSSGREYGHVGPWLDRGVRALHRVRTAVQRLRSGSQVGRGDPEYG